MNELFDHFYIINLDRRKDRWERITKELAEQCPELKPKRFTAIDGSKFPTPDFWMPTKNKVQREGSYGCFLSHIRLIEQAINESWSGVMIWEDDVTLCPNFKEELETALSNIPPVFDILYLGGQHVQTDRKEPSILNEWWAKGYNINRTHAYYIPRHYLKTVYAHFLRFGEGCPSQHIDWQLGELCKKRDSVFIIPVNPLCYQGGGISDIGNETNLNTFLYNFNQFPQQIGTALLDLKLCFSEVGFGQVGINELGYKGEFKLIPNDETVYISAHSPSFIIISSTQSIRVKCMQNKDMSSFGESICFVDRKLIGTVKEAGSSTKAVNLDPGVHFLNIETKNNGQAHTIWEVGAK